MGIEKIILEKLAEIEQKENVRVLYAVESGSRAWGVASPDSDYDVRFIYVRRWEDYLKLQEFRDVIEWQLDEVLDINGWDLKKTLQHFHKGNATLFEWCNSPVVYQTSPEWESISRIGAEYFSEKYAMYHYYGTARGTYEKYLTEETVRYKKYVYALRPLLACQYIEEHHSAPPVLFDELARLQLPDALKSPVDRMLAVKTGGGEKDAQPQIPEIIDFIRQELERLSVVAKDNADDRNPSWEPLERIFLETVMGNSELSPFSLPAGRSVI